MPIFAAIIGNRNSGKSTIIKSLTGCPSGQFRGCITDKATGRSIEVIGASPQEMELTLPELKAILKRGLREGSNGVICALQPTKPSKRISIEDAIEAALALGYKVHPFILDPEHSGPADIYESTCNRIPLGTMPPVRLDARRFPHLNATVIHGYTSIAA